MSRALIYFLKSMVILIMELYKSKKKYLFILFLIFLIIPKLYANIIYNKNQIIITDYELNEFKNNYEKNFNTIISYNNAIKQIFLIKKNINRLLEQNPEAIENIDKKILEIYGTQVLNNEINKNFYRFLILRQEYSLSYFNNKIDIEEFFKIFSKIKSLKLPISKNNCVTFDQVIELKNNKEFIENLFNNLKNKTNSNLIKINNEIYSICISNKNYNQIQSFIFRQIEQLSENDFKNYIYKL